MKTKMFTKRAIASALAVAAAFVAVFYVSVTANAYTTNRPHLTWANATASISDITATDIGCGIRVQYTSYSNTAPEFIYVYRTGSDGKHHGMAINSTNLKSCRKQSNAGTRFNVDITFPIVHAGTYTAEVHVWENTNHYGRTIKSTTVQYAGMTRFDGTSKYDPNHYYDTFAVDYPELTDKPMAEWFRKKGINDASSDEDTAEAIQTYIGRYFKYDYAKMHANNSSTDAYYSWDWNQSPKGTWQSKKGTCGDFALLEVSLFRSYGIDSYVVRDDTHNWVHAKIDGSWKYFDPTENIGTSYFQKISNMHTPDKEAELNL